MKQRCQTEIKSQRECIYYLHGRFFFGNLLDLSVGMEFVITHCKGVVGLLQSHGIMPPKDIICNVNGSPQTASFLAFCPRYHPHSIHSKMVSISRTMRFFQ